MRHPDFQKIYQAFMMRYGGSPAPCREGEVAYQDWLRKLNLDETKPYGESQRQTERFSWIKPHIEFIREDTDAKYYKVEALIPWTSMNGTTYTREELAAATRTMIGKVNNLNHTDEFLDIEIKDAEFEDDIVELLVRIPKNAACRYGRLIDLIDNAESEKYGIVNVSIEAGNTRGVTPTGEGVQVNGLIFTGLAWLTKNVLPGVPLTRITPVEKLVEAYAAQQAEKTEGNETPTGETMTEKIQELISDLKQMIEELQTKMKELSDQVAAIQNPPAPAPAEPQPQPQPESAKTEKLEPKPEEKPNPSPAPEQQPAQSEPTPAPEAGETGEEKLDVTTKDGFWTRYNQLQQDEKLSRGDAFRIVSMELFEKIKEKQTQTQTKRK